MAGRWELGLPSANEGGACSLKERLARITVNNFRKQGHTYVELRQNGKRFVFFCTLCLAPCYSDNVLIDHLRGTLHNERLAAAKLTFLKPNPWPFNDGINFFDCNVNGKAKQLGGVLDGNVAGENLAIVEYRGNGVSSGGKDLGCGGERCDLVIPCVLIKDKVTELRVKLMGLGKISTRFCEKGKGAAEVSRIWCEWLGNDGDSQGDGEKVVEHDYAIVTFSYSYDLGNGSLDDVKLLLSSNHRLEIENAEGGTKKRKKLCSDPGDMSEALGNQYDSSGEESSSSSGATSNSKLILDQYDDQLLHSRFMSSKTLRRELRRQQRVAAERMCDICQQKMLPEKDVAALMNMKTGKLACSSRNENGAFHVFHVSCLVHWILLCELEMLGHQSVYLKRRSRRTNGATKSPEMAKRGKIQNLKTRIDSVFCSECQGTGLHMEGDELEGATFPLSEMFKFKIKVGDGRRGWMKSPEMLENCSTGFHFPSVSIGEIQEKVLPLKLLRFYRAAEE